MSTLVRVMLACKREGSNKQALVASYWVSVVVAENLFIYVVAPLR